MTFTLQSSTPILGIENPCHTGEEDGKLENGRAVSQRDSTCGTVVDIAKSFSQYAERA